MTAQRPHVPVMLSEVLAALKPVAGEIYIDGTFGAGGYTEAILNSADCKVIGIDRDASAIATAQTMTNKFNGRLIPVHGAFGDIESHLNGLGIEQVDALILDLGVSSMQLDQPERGFSFAKDGPLDMRMDRDSGEPAHVLVNTMDEQELADLIFKYGEERHSRRIAAAIVRARAERKIETTLVLAGIVADAVPGKAGKYSIHPATRTFQALRIAVNGELDQIEQALDASLRILRPGGRLIIVSFHSLEDTIVKSFMQKHSGKAESVSRHLPVSKQSTPALFNLPSRKAIQCNDAEAAANPRARSAKLRWAIRTDERIAA